MLDLWLPKRRREFRWTFQRTLKGVLNKIKALYVHTGCQKNVTQELLSALILNLQEMVREIISRPKRHAAIATITTTTITNTTTTTATTTISELFCARITLRLIDNAVKFGNEISSWFRIKLEVKQGCVLSPFI